MKFQDSIITCFKKFAEFEGRASRPEFWWFTLFIVLIASALTYVSETAGSVFLILVILPFISAGARRLHDICRSASWLWFLLVPIGGLIMLAILWAQPTTSTPCTVEAAPA